MNIEEVLGEKITVNPNWFYHATRYERKKYASILSQGILSSKQQEATEFTYDYVFVSKIEDKPYSAYISYRFYPSFVIDESVKTVSVYSHSLIRLYNHLRHGMIDSHSYNGEYQIYQRILPKDILAIAFNLTLLQRGGNLDLAQLHCLRFLTLFLEENGINLNIIDPIAQREISKEKVLTKINL